MDAVDIKGRELHFLRMALNHQQHGTPYTIDALTIPRFQSQWSEDFIRNLETKELLRFGESKIYVTELAINSIHEKDKNESRLIEEQIVEDGFEYAFLTFMDNRNEPVPMLDMPGNFEYHSEIHMEPINGSETSFRTWDDQIHKYITAPNVDGYILNHTGKKMLEKLKKEKRLKEENETLDTQIKQQTISNTKFTRNVAYSSLFVAGLSVFVTFGIWLIDKDKTQKTSTEIPQLQKVTQAQEKLQQSLQDVQKTLQNLDTSVKRVKIVK